jgi:Na+/proline symporter
MTEILAGIILFCALVVAVIFVWFKFAVLMGWEKE